MNDITIVHHVSPDLDSLVASFLAASFLVAPGERVQYEFVPVGTAGQSLLPSRIVVAGRGARRVAGHSKLAEASAAHVLFAYIAEHGVRNATPSFEPADAIALVAYARAERMYTNGVDGLLAEAGGDIRSPAASLLRQVGLGRLVAGLHAMARVQALPGSENEHALAAWNPIASSISLSACHGHVSRIPALTPSLSLFAGDDNAHQTLIAATGADVEHPAARALLTVGPGAWGFTPLSTLNAVVALAEADMNVATRLHD